MSQAAEDGADGLLCFGGGDIEEWMGTEGQSEDTVGGKETVKQTVKTVEQTLKS